jgi:hypothetical protein
LPSVIGGPAECLNAAAIDPLFFAVRRKFSFESKQQFFGKHVPRFGHIQKDRAILAVSGIFREPSTLGCVTAISLNSIHFRSLYSPPERWGS